jgi:hypothetical protein
MKITKVIRASTDPAADSTAAWNNPNDNVHADVSSSVSIGQ